MRAANFMDSMKRALRAGDASMEQGRYHEAIETYQRIVDLYRVMEESQKPETPGGPTQVPLGLRLIVLNRDRIVPLDRLAAAHLGLGDRASALLCLREVVACLEKAIQLAGAETRVDLERDLAKAREKLSHVEFPLTSSAATAENFWVAYRGRDTGQQIRVYPEANQVSAERLRLLLSSAAQHQGGQVSQVFEAESQAEAERMAPFQFV